MSKAKFKQRPMSPEALRKLNAIRQVLGIDDPMLVIESCVAFAYEGMRPLIELENPQKGTPN